MNINELTAETILSDSVFDELFSELDIVEREKLICLLLDRAKVLGVKGKFDKLLAANKAQHKKMQKQEAQEKAQALAIQRREMRQIAMTNYYSDKYPDLLCGAWECDESGVRTYGMFGEVIACYNPILPVKRLINIETNNEKMIIAFKKNGHWREVVIDKLSLLSTAKICNALLNVGVLTSTENAKYLVRYFLEIEAMNIDVLPEQKTISRMGWVDSFSQFIPYQSNSIIYDGDDDFISALTKKGNRGKYIEQLKIIRKRDRIEPMFCIAVSLASVLCEPLGVLPHILHLFGEGGKGKTLATMWGASIWGNPNEKAGLIADPKSTRTGFEVMLNFLSNLPFICDDMSKLKDSLKSQKIDYGEFIYFLCGMTGKRRSNVNLTTNKIMHWHNCSLTNAEKPITSEISNGGELLRVFELKAEDGDIFKDGSKGKITADFVRANYGFLGQEFISVICEIGMDEVKRIYQDYIKILEEKDTRKEKEGKQINPVALWLTADKIFTDYIMQDGVYLDVDICFSLIKSNDQMSDNDRAYEFVLNEISMHKKKFLKTDVEPDQRWGYFLDDEALINPNAFTGFCERGNFNKKMFVEWAVSKGLSRVDSEKGRIRTTKKFNNTEKGIIGNFIVIKTKGIDDSGLEEIDDDDPLPFMD